MYTPPGTLTAAERSPSSERNHYRSRSFTDETGPGAFAPLSGIPRRHISRPSTPKFNFPSSTPSATNDRPPSPAVRSPKFNIAGGSGSSEDSDGDDDEDVPINSAPLANKVVAAAVTNGTANDGPPTPPPEAIPFPSISISAANSPVVITAASPICRSVSSPQIQTPSCDDHLAPSIYRSPYSSMRSEPSSRLHAPLKPALKSNHSSPHLPSLANQRALTQSAPSTPNLTAWQNGGRSGQSSTPGSPGSTYSVPQTPKQVHFASEKSHLESVVVFTKGTRPRSLSNPGGNDTETETEGYDSSGPSWASSRYPFPVMPKDDTVVVLDESLTSEVPAKSAIGYNGYSMDGTDRRFVLLETVTLPSAKPPTLRGSVLVRNIAFQKRVAIRFTLDDWQTTSEVSCPHSASLQALPPPFSTHTSASGSGHSRSATISHMPSDRPISNGGKGDSWDRFTFQIKLEDVERSLPTKKMFLVVRYQVPSQWGFESGGEWWDNNDTKNYEIAFKLGKKQTSAANHVGEEFSPAGLSARLTASLQRQQQQEANTSQPSRTQSLPPLPPPGPVRSSASPVSLSPVSSVLGLKLNKPALPPLATHEQLPKLRLGRGPTFAEVRNSPPGSPAGRNSPTRTAYTPPLPGTVPGITHGIITPAPAAVEKKEEPKPTGLTISTTGLDSPTSTIGKKRGLSLSNYASPSPSSIKSPTVPNNSSTSLASLMTGGDGGENAYKYAYRKDSGPVTPELKIVGGMPATIVEDNALSGRQASVPPPRISSWDTPLNGIWTALGGVSAPEKVKTQREEEEEEEDDGMLALPTPPDSADSMLSTPDLERSPDQEPPTLIGGSDKEPERDSPTPTSMEEAAAASTSSVPFPSASPTPSPTVATFVEQPARRSPPETSSTDSDSHPPPLSHLGRRTSEQTGKMMRLKMPARQTFKSPPESALVITPAPVVTKGSSPPSTGSSSPDRGSPTRKAGRRPSPPLSDGNPSLGLALNLTSPGSANGPPAEFLAKYCFYVSSPAVSPPTSTNSPSHNLSVGSPALLNAFGTGIDTPRASSPGLASAAAFWGYPGASTVAPPDNAALGTARV